MRPRKATCGRAAPATSISNDAMAANSTPLRIPSSSTATSATIEILTESDAEPLNPTYLTPARVCYILLAGRRRAVRCQRSGREARGGADDESRILDRTSLPGGRDEPPRGGCRGRDPLLREDLRLPRRLPKGDAPQVRDPRPRSDPDRAGRERWGPVAGRLLLQGREHRCRLRGDQRRASHRF